MHECRAMILGDPSREMALFTCNDGEVCVFWYACNGIKVYPIDMTDWWVVPGVKVADLPFVHASGTKAAFAVLSEAIEAVRDDVQEEKYCQLYKAAKKAFDAAM